MERVIYNSIFWFLGYIVWLGGINVIDVKYRLFFVGYYYNIIEYFFGVDIVI